MKIISIIIVLLELTILFFVDLGFVQAEVIDRVVGKVNDAIITLSEVEDRAKLMRVNLGQLSGSKELPNDKELLNGFFCLLLLQSV